MINLLPGDTKKQIRSARTNISLINYIVFLLLAAIFLAAACVTVYVFLGSIKTAAEQSIQYKSTSANKADSPDTAIATAKSILDRQISYSDIIFGLSSELPPGVIIERLSLNENSLSNPVMVDFHARSVDGAGQLVSNLQQSTLFSNVIAQPAINSVGNSPEYPILISCKLTINKESMQL